MSYFDPTWSRCLLVTIPGKASDWPDVIPVERIQLAAANSLRAFRDYSELRRHLDMLIRNVSSKTRRRCGGT